MDERATALIEALRASSIRFRAKAGPAIDAAMSLAEHVLAADPVERSRIADAVDVEVARKLNGVCGRLAERAMNQHDPRFLTAALVALGLAAGKEDEREQVRRFVLVAAAAKETGVDVQALLRDVAAVPDLPGAALLQRFAARDPANESLAAFRIRLVEKDGEKHFEPIQDEWS